MRARARHGVTAAALGLALAGCAAPPPERYLRLDPVAVALPAPAHPLLDGNLQVLFFRARGLLGERHVVYLEAGTGEARPSATLLWEDAPAAAVARIVTVVLQAASVSSAVLPPDSRGLAALWLDGSIDRFELVGMPGQAVVQLDFTVLAGRERQPALLARYCRSEPSGATPARAFSLATAEIAARLAGDLAANAAMLNAVAAGGPAATVLIGQQIGATGAGCGGDA